MSMALRAITDDGNFFAVKSVNIAILLIVDFNCHGNFLLIFYCGEIYDGLSRNFPAGLSNGKLFAALFQSNRTGTDHLL